MKRKHVLLLSVAVLLGLTFGGASVTSVSASSSRAVAYEVYHSPRGKYGNRQIVSLARQRAKYYHPSVSWNFRDIGGYNTANNKYHVKTRKLFLSSYIANIHRRGANVIKHFHIHTDIDMRNYSMTPTSIKKQPQPGEMGLRSDPYHLHLKYKHYPVESSMSEHKDYGRWPSKTDYDRHAEVDKFKGTYLLTRTARRAYRNSFYEVMRATRGRNAVMFNCNSGRDRSASFAAMILATLGVGKSKIEENYLLTNFYHYQTPYKYQFKRITTWYHTLDKHYGSVYGYERKGLGLSKHFIRQFKKRFLVRNHR